MKLGCETNRFCSYSYSFLWCLFVLKVWRGDSAIDRLIPHEICDLLRKNDGVD